GGSRTAVKDLTKLLKEPLSSWDRALALATLARVRLVTGPLKEAKENAEEAVAAAPHSGRAHLARGLVALKQKDDALAKESLLKAAELEPAAGPVRLALGDYLARENDTELLKRAVKEYEAF